MSSRMRQNQLGRRPTMSRPPGVPARGGVVHRRGGGNSAWGAPVLSRMAAPFPALATSCETP